MPYQGVAGAGRPTRAGASDRAGLVAASPTPGTSTAGTERLAAGRGSWCGWSSNFRRRA